MTSITYSLARLPAPVAMALAAAVPPAHQCSSTIAAFLDIAPAAPSTAPADRALVVNWSGYVHHSAGIVAAAVGALVDPRMAAAMTGEAWGMRLVRAVAGVPGTDHHERAVLAALGGVLLLPDHGATRAPFTTALFGLVERRGLDRFFFREPEAPDHYELVPKLDGLTKAAKDLAPVDRVILSVIVGLYRGDGWPDGFKRAWNPPTAEAFGLVNTLWPQSPDDVRDFYSLLALYPGW